MVTDVCFERGILFRWITPESLLNGFRAWPRLGSSIRNFKWVSHSKWIRHLLKKTFYVWISLGNYFIISFSEVGCTLVDGGGLLKIESVLCIRRYVYCKGGKNCKELRSYAPLDYAFRFILKQVFVMPLFCFGFSSNLWQVKKIQC